MEKDNDILNKISQNDLEINEKNEIGKGAFGKVLVATEKKSGEKVAIKKIFENGKYKNNELPIFLEINQLNHPNIIQLKSYFYSKEEKFKENECFLNYVMEYVPLTLSNLILQNKKNNCNIDSILIKLFSFQILKGIGYLHSIGIAHRDLKPPNILINQDDYSLKLCDFGSAKHIIKSEKNVSYICNRYYRAPELLIGATRYSTQVDLWSAGCVIAEMILNQPIFYGKTTKNQLLEIINILGTPSTEQIKLMNEKSKKIKLPKVERVEWKDFFKGKTNDENYIDLISNLLLYEPTKRFRPYEALCHPFFDELKKKDVRLPENKTLPKHLFEFKDCEMNFDKESIQKLLSQIEK